MQNACMVATFSLRQMSCEACEVINNHINGYFWCESFRWMLNTIESGKCVCFISNWYCSVYICSNIFKRNAITIFWFACLFFLHFKCFFARSSVSFHRHMHTYTYARMDYVKNANVTTSTITKKRINLLIGSFQVSSNFKQKKETESTEMLHINRVKFNFHIPQNCFFRFLQYG